MLKLKLKSFLKQHQITEAMLADAMAEISPVTVKPVSERYLRYLSSNTHPLQPGSPGKKPSLTMLSLILEGLNHLIDDTVNLENILDTA